MSLKPSESCLAITRRQKSFGVEQPDDEAHVSAFESRVKSQTGPIMSNEVLTKVSLIRRILDKTRNSIFFILCSPVFCMAAQSDCMQSAADGQAQCTPPRISPFTYDACSPSLVIFILNIESQCRANVVGSGPIETEGQLAAMMSCVRAAAGAPPVTTFAWKPQGSTQEVYNCGTFQSYWKYGQEIFGYAQVGGHPGSGDNYFATRRKAVECPHGYTASGSDNSFGLPNYCVRHPKLACEREGNPVGIVNGEKEQTETDFEAAAHSPLMFQRHYSSLGWYSAMNNAQVAQRGFGDFWRHTYSRRIISEDSPYLMASAIRQDGLVKHFRPDGAETARQTSDDDKLVALGGGGWRLYTGTAMETYDASGRIVAIHSMRGGVESMQYSDNTTPPSVAPEAGFLIGVADQFGRTLGFTYDPVGRLRTFADPANNFFQYKIDIFERLEQVRFPDATTRVYRYQENPNYANSGGKFSLTGIIDELGNRYGTYGYRDEYNGTPNSTEHAGGVDRYLFYPLSPNQVRLVDPLGSIAQGNVRDITFTTVLGVPRVVAQTQPAGSGCLASNSSAAYDVGGNLASKNDFNGVRTCFAFDPVRNLEVTRVEGLAANANCSAQISNTSGLAPDNRKVSTAWHPDWRVRIRIAEPGSVTHFIYHGQPDPTSGNTIATCAPPSALMPDGKPLALLCKKVSVATSDTTGGFGFAATPEVNVPLRVWRWTYNSYGQVLTESDALNNVKNFVYYESTAFSGSVPLEYGHTQGDLRSVIDPLGRSTEFISYDRSGRILKSRDPNGTESDYGFDARQRIIRVSTGAETTLYSYWPTGRLKKITRPDASYVEYEYDAAHRLEAVSDNLGNRTEYTLDNAGNAVTEVVRDPMGRAKRTILRSIDALGRIQQVTGD